MKSVFDKWATSEANKCFFYKNLSSPEFNKVRYVVLRKDDNLDKRFKCNKEFLKILNEDR